MTIAQSKKSVKAKDAKGVRAVMVDWVLAS